MPVSRQKTLYELAIQTTAASLNDEVLATLGAATSSSVAAQVAPIEANVATISGNLNTAIAANAATSAALSSYTPLSTTIAVSGFLATDINNLDLSLTASVVSVQDSITATNANVASISASLITVQGTIYGNLMKFEGWTSAPTSAPITADLWASVNITGSLYKFPVWVA